MLLANWRRPHKRSNSIPKRFPKSFTLIQISGSPQCGQGNPGINSPNMNPQCGQKEEMKLSSMPFMLIAIRWQSYQLLHQNPLFYCICD